MTDSPTASQQPCRPSRRAGSTASRTRDIFYSYRRSPGDDRRVDRCSSLISGGGAGALDRALQSVQSGARSI